MNAPKLSLDPATPTEKIMSQESVALPKEVKDVDGRVYTLRLPDALDEFDLSAALGKDSTNLGILAQAMPLIYIESIDDEPFKKPNSYAEIRAALKRIGRNGMRAVSAVVFKHTADEQANQEANLAEIKK